MCADTQQYEPLRLLDPLTIVFLVAQGGHVDRLLLLNLLRCAMSHEQGLVPPLEGGTLSLGDVGQVHLDLGEGKHIGRGTHGLDEHLYYSFATVGYTDGTAWGEIFRIRLNNMNIFFLFS